MRPLQTRLPPSDRRSSREFRAGKGRDLTRRESLPRGRRVEKGPGMRAEGPSTSHFNEIKASFDQMRE